MASWNIFSQTTPAPTPATPPTPETPPAPEATLFCQRKRSKDAGFVANAKEYMSSFIHAPMDEHKACFKARWQKVIGKFKEDKSIPAEGPVLVQAAAKN